MKHIFLRTIFFLLASNTFSQIDRLPERQDSTKARTRIEAFQRMTSSLLLKEFITIRKTKEIEIEIVKVSTVNQPNAVTGVIIRWGITTMGLFAETGSSYLDIDEIQDLINSIELMLKMSVNPVSENYTELTFSTKSGLEISLFSKISKSAKTWNSAISHQYKYQSFRSLSLIELATIKSSLDEARKKL